MTGRSILGSLWRTLTARGRAAAPFADWADLLARLDLPPQALRDVVAAGSLQPHFTYRCYRKPKKAGGWREIAEPDAGLKRIQHEIIRRYFVAEQPHPAALAYQKGKSTAQHVWAHAGAAVIV